MKYLTKFNEHINPLTEEIKQKLYDYFEGTCNSLYSAIYKFDLTCTLEDIEDAMLDFNIEKCPSCGWWCECHDRIPDDGDGLTPDNFCTNCR